MIKVVYSIMKSIKFHLIKEQFHLFITLFQCPPPGDHFTNNS